LRNLDRRNLIILAILLLVSLFWRSVEITASIACGGVLVIASNRWMQHSLRVVMQTPDKGASSRFRLGYMIRLATLFVALYLLIAQVGVHPIGLIVGMSVIVINLMLFTAQRLL